MPNLTVSVTPELLREAKIYASQHNTNLSDIVRGYLIQLTQTNKTILAKYADGSISSAEAQDLLNLKNKGELFHAVCSAGLGIYHIDKEKAEKMANGALVLARLN